MLFNGVQLTAEGNSLFLKDSPPLGWGQELTSEVVGPSWQKNVRVGVGKDISGVHPRQQGIGVMSVHSCDA